MNHQTDNLVTLWMTSYHHHRADRCTRGEATRLADIWLEAIKPGTSETLRAAMAGTEGMLP